MLRNLLVLLLAVVGICLALPFDEQPTRTVVKRQGASPVPSTSCCPNQSPNGLALSSALSLFPLCVYLNVLSPTNNVNCNYDSNGVLVTALSSGSCPSTAAVCANPTRRSPIKDLLARRPAPKTENASKDLLERKAIYNKRKAW
ncbi:hypothetical protein IAU60_003132 [Kwoniella sp. DSM 27419]